MVEKYYIRIVDKTSIISVILVANNNLYNTFIKHITNLELFFVNLLNQS